MKIKNHPNKKKRKKGERSGFICYAEAYADEVMCALVNIVVTLLPSSFPSPPWFVDWVCLAPEAESDSIPQFFLWCQFFLSIASRKRDIFGDEAISIVSDRAIKLVHGKRECKKSSVWPPLSLNMLSLLT